ncbi:MAG: peptidoglycan-binding protein [endosymbiont of Galathealinum brachiosum]|uniref:Peptidoglycan-binding protein n=1 Tax=endosymbiont of Galathealinum brachiosum TaxID=2200906 RepID=A0A370DE30_9GAMM|nr:MAG: peptidoglycan-binding protein [endosymbiont of Galathealinum brachiosum]
MPKYGRFALLLASAALISACSSTPTAKNNEPAPFEPQSGSIEPVNTPDATEASEDEATSTQSFQLAADHPREYIVKKGDTLWDIASMFLQDPWFWPEIWQRNPQVQNPHLIYPGDILTLTYVNGVPRIQVARAAEGEDVIRRESTDTGGRKVVKLSPSIHRQTLNEAIPSIPADAVRQFLTRPRVVSEDEWANAPYIVGSDDAHLVLGANNKVYVRGELDKERSRYSVFREGNRLVDPDTDELLGFEVVYAGEIRIHKYATPSSGLLLSTSREVLVGDRLLPTDKSAIDQQYFPRLPDNYVDGKVISLFDAISSIAKYQVAVINRGSNDNLEVGHLLATYQAGGYAKDRFLDRTSRDRDDEDKLEILLPDERSGLMMLFKVFDKVSYGLILKSTRTISNGDKVDKPR